MKKTALMIGLVVMTACQPAPDSESSSVNTEASCQAVGGRLMVAKIGPVCSMPAFDAGQTCSSSQQCGGLCMANGQCSTFESNFGCQEILEDGKPVTICID